MVPDKEVLFLFVKGGVCSQLCPQNLSIECYRDEGQDDQSSRTDDVPNCGLDSIAISLFGNIIGI